MLCNKCKTSIIEGDKNCGYCGTPVKITNNFWMIYIISIILILLVFLNFSNLIAGDGTNELKPDAEASIPLSDADNQPNNIDTSAKPTATPFVAFESGEDKDEVIIMTENIAKSASSYVSAGMKYVYFLSKNGYLYDDVNNKYISPLDLVNVEGFKKEYESETALILYLKTNEFAMLANDGGYADELAVFCAYETMKGFYLSSAEGYIGIISRESLGDLLKKYSQDHGDITRFQSDSDEFDAINNSIQNYSANFADINTRYIAGDKKYAFAVVSFKGHDNIIKEYALKNENGNWKVFCSDFEALYDYKTVINSICPDFNSDIFPSYSFYFHGKFLRNDFSDIIGVLIDRIYIAENDSKPLFASGNDLFSYLEFPNNRKLLCYTPSNALISVYPIVNYAEGESVMRVLSKDPPLYILKQD